MKKDKFGRTLGKNGKLINPLSPKQVDGRQLLIARTKENREFDEFIKRGVLAYWGPIDLGEDSEA